MHDTLDLGRMFFGDTPPIFLLEIALRTTILFSYTLILMRLLGHRNQAQLTIAEFTLIIALGSAVGDPMFYGDVPVIHGILVITLIVVYQFGITRIAQRSRTAARMLDGTATRLVIDGRLDAAGVDHARLTEGEVYAELRQQGIEQLGEVRRAYLEPDGAVSVFKYDADAVKSGRSIMPEQGQSNP